MAPCIITKCIVCGDSIKPRTNVLTNFCSECQKPCHTKCAGKKKNAPCDLCRAAEQRRQKKYDAIQHKRQSAKLAPISPVNNTSPKAKEEGASLATALLTPGGVTPAQNNKGTGHQQQQQRHSTSAPITPSKNNIIVRNTEGSDQELPLLPRSWLSVFTPTRMRSVTPRHTLSPSTGVAIINNSAHNISENSNTRDTSNNTSNDTSNNTSCNDSSSALTSDNVAAAKSTTTKASGCSITPSAKPSHNLSVSTPSSPTVFVNLPRSSTTRLDSSLIKNGTIISTLVTYANSVHDAVEVAITSQQGSIASKLEEIATSLSVLPSLTQKIGNLESKVDSLEALLAERTKQLNTTAKECEILREQINKQSSALDTKLVAFEDNLSAAVKSIKENNNNSAVSFPVSDNKSDTSASLSSNDNTELLLSNFIHNKECNLKKAAFTNFHAVLDSISLDDIVSCRLSVAKVQPGSSVSTSDTRPPPFFVRLRSPKIVNEILAAKRSYNLLHTRDLDLSLLDPDDQQKVFDSTIFFNEVLAKHNYKYFKNLKQIAKSHGFKYVWHRKGSFLVKRNDGERTHVFKSAADLAAIAATYTKPLTLQANVASNESA